MISSFEKNLSRLLTLSSPKQVIRGTNVEFQISFKIKFQNRFSRREFMLAVNSPFSVRKPIPDTSAGT